VESGEGRVGKYSVCKGLTGFQEDIYATASSFPGRKNSQNLTVFGNLTVTDIVRKHGRGEGRGKREEGRGERGE
jgi:hypothetical protein